MVWRLAASVAIAFVSGAIGWGLRGEVGDGPRRVAQVGTEVVAAGFVQRATIAHVVYEPDRRRAVKVTGDYEDQLAAWLSKRMGARMNQLHLQALGYVLEGGCLLPGGEGPVAQFMYQDASCQRLTLYVSNKVRVPGRIARSDTAFRFAQEGAVNVLLLDRRPLRLRPVFLCGPRRNGVCVLPRSTAI